MPRRRHLPLELHAEGQLGAERQPRYFTGRHGVTHARSRATGILWQIPQRRYPRHENKQHQHQGNCLCDLAGRDTQVLTGLHPRLRLVDTDQRGGDDKQHRDHVERTERVPELKEYRGQDKVGQHDDHIGVTQAEHFHQLQRKSRHQQCHAGLGTEHRAMTVKGCQNHRTEQHTTQPPARHMQPSSLDKHPPDQYQRHQHHQPSRTTDQMRQRCEHASAQQPAKGMLWNLVKPRHQPTPCSPGLPNMASAFSAFSRCNGPLSGSSSAPGKRSP